VSTVSTSAEASANVTAPTPKITITSPYANSTASVSIPIVSAGVSKTIISPSAISNTINALPIPIVAVMSVSIASAAIGNPVPAITITSPASLANAVAFGLIPTRKGYGNFSILSRGSSARIYTIKPIDFEVTPRSSPKIVIRRPVTTTYAPTADHSET
jgi:hypothetical protein